MANWVMILIDFDIEYVDRKSIKGQPIVDQLTDAHLYDNNPLVSDFLDESIFLLHEFDH
jgi:hypothetical protein